MDKNDRSVELLRALHDIGAINLDVLVKEADKVRGVLGEAGFDPDWPSICYKFTMHIGPRDFDLVDVAAQIRELGYEFNRIG